MLLSAEPSEAKEKSSAMINRFVHEKYGYEDFVIGQGNRQGSREKEVKKSLDEWQERWDMMAEKADGRSSGGN